MLKSKYLRRHHFSFAPFLDPILSDSENEHIYLSDPLCPSGELRHRRILARSEGAALWKWWPFISGDAVTRCNQLMYPTKSDKSPFASWLSRFCGCPEQLWGHKAATFFWTEQRWCIVGYSTCSLILSLNEKTWIPCLALSLCVPSVPEDGEGKREREK